MSYHIKAFELMIVNKTYQKCKSKHLIKTFTFGADQYLLSKYNGTMPIYYPQLIKLHFSGIIIYHR